MSTNKYAPQHVDAPVSRFRWFGPLLASRITGKVFTHPDGRDVVLVAEAGIWTDEAAKLDAAARSYLNNAIAWAKAIP